jgi:uncharacterized phiE125 gp8 family phage protein
MAQFYPYVLRRHSLIGAELLSLAEAKLYLRIDHDEEDNVISGFIQAARETAEDSIKSSLAQQQWTLSYHYQFPSVIHLPMAPVDSIVSVSLEDNNGIVTPLNSSSCILNKTESKVTFQSVIYGGSLSIIYQTAQSAIDETLRQAMLAHIHALYEDRGAATVPAISRDTYYRYRKIAL